MTNGMRHYKNTWVYFRQVAVEQKYAWGGWCERLRSSRLSARSVHVQRSKSGGWGFSPPSPLSSAAFALGFFGYISVANHQDSAQ